ncbi:MAG TPA: ATP-binding protein [Kofleriaceae bacterium]|nr:ATP-binding protein [Kofleriaceae bacterium]
MTSRLTPAPDPLPRREEMLRELGRISWSGTIGHLVLFLLVELRLPHADGLPRAAMFALFFGCMLARVVGALLVRADRGSLALRIGCIAAGSVATNIVWGARIVAVQLRTGAGPESLIMSTVLCGIATGGVMALAPSRLLQTAALSVLILPSIVVGLQRSGLGSLAVLHALFFGYVLALGVAANRRYWTSVHSTELLRQHAASAQQAAIDASNTNTQLRIEIDQRAKMEVELRQAHKLEAIGRLAAGIAHEINTPVQFVSDSCRFLGDGIAQLTEAVDDYERVLAHAGGDLAAARATIESERDLPYLRDNLPIAVQRALDGLGRVAAIVAATKEFAYPYRGEKALTDINKAIQSTLIICNNETKYVADLQVELGAVPPVLCHPGELSQAILNLVVNAAHAIADAPKHGDQKGTICIRTWTEPGWVRISIRDTGTGIPAAILDKIYEPFFTTKEVGKGSGQGLAIVRAAIVDKHDGTVDVASEPGVGTTFTLGLPLAA